MVEVDNYRKLLPVSIIYIYKRFEHINRLYIGILLQPYTVIPTILDSDYGVLGHLLSRNDIITSWLRLTATSNCFLHPHFTLQSV